MDEQAMINDLIAQLDAGFEKGVGHMNVSTDDNATNRQVRTMGCNDCARTPLTSSVPTRRQGLSDYL